MSTLLEMQSEALSFENSRTAKRDREFNIKANNILESNYYQNLMESENQYKEINEQISETAKMSVMKSSRDVMKKKFRNKLKLSEQLKFEIFSESIGDLFYKSLLLDEDFKQPYRYALNEYSYKKLKNLYENGEIDFNNSSKYIQNVWRFSEATAKLLAEAIDKECTCKKCKGAGCADCDSTGYSDIPSDLLKSFDGQDSLQTLRVLNEKDPEYNLSEKNDFSKTSKNLVNGRYDKVVDDKESKNVPVHDSTIEMEKDIAIKDVKDADNYKEYVQDMTKNVSEVIRDKVSTVIQNEKDKSEMEKDYIEQIKKDLDISYGSQTELDTENTSITDAVVNDKSETIPASSGVTATNENAKIKFVRNSKKLSEMHLFKAIMINTGKHYFAEQAELVKSGKKQKIDVNMDYVLAESIMEYTFLEMLNTTGIKKVNKFNNQSLVNKYMLS